MSSPVLMLEPGALAGLPEQGLVLCQPCKAINLPGANYCCMCGLPLAGGALDDPTRAEVEGLVAQARQQAAGGPVWAEVGSSFQSRVHEQAVSLWPAGLASHHFQSDPWSALAEVNDACVLLIERLDGPVKSVVPFLETVVNAQKSLVVVTGYLDPEVLATFVINHLKNTLKSVVLLLSLPQETHPVLLADLAAVLRGKVVERPRLERTTAASLPTVKSLLAGSEQSWACGVAELPAPNLSGDPVVVQARRRIYGQKAVRIELGANSRADVETRRRYACRLLRPGAARVTERSTQLMPGSTSGLQGE